MNRKTITASLVIRDAIDEDVEVCLAMDHAYTTEHVWQMEMNDDNERVSMTFRTVRLPRPMRVVYPRNPNLLRAAWQRRDCFMVALIDEQVRGYLNMRVDVAHGNARVMDLAVEPDWRRQGIGGALLKAARLWAREQNLSRLIVETQTKNYPGICFCQKYGLAFCGFNDQYYPNQDIALFFGQRVR